MPGGPYDCGKLVDQAQSGSGEDRACPVELVEQPGDGGVAGVAGGPEDAHPQDAALLVRNDVGLRPEQFREGTARSAFAALGRRDGEHHPGLGPVGDHADHVEEQPLAGGQRVEPFALAEFRGPVVRGHLPALQLERLALGVERPDLGRDPFGRPGGRVGRRAPEQVRGAVAQRAEPAPHPADHEN